MIRLVTRADDAGCAVSANRAIRDACVDGIARNISLMAPTPAIADAAARLAGLDHVAFGLHVTMTAEWERPRWPPLIGSGPGRLLCDDDGCLVRRAQTLHGRGVDAGLMMTEVEAQLARLRELGFRISYIDEHMGVGWVGGLSQALRELAAREGLVYAPALQSLPKEHRDGHDHATPFIAALRSVGGGDYLSVAHPVYDDAEMRGFEGCGQDGAQIAQDRDGQRLKFMRSDVVAAVRERGIRLTRYDEL